MGNHDLLERAFALADGGLVRTVEDIRGARLVEGYTSEMVRQLGGPVLSPRSVQELRLLPVGQVGLASPAQSASLVPLVGRG